MPSHSKKQHNFMEAIAHSPSFAKKVHIPQSVGKDYAAADKGKTFGKGGEMKESKAMVGKEVAFMKKKGAPAKMIKHEMSEMKGMKAGGRVRKMAEGGLNDMGEGAALSNRSYGYEEEKEQGAKNLEGIKNFFGFGKKKDEAPIDRSRDKQPPEIRPSMGGPSASSATSRVSSQSPRTRRGNEDTSDSDAVERSDAASMDKTTKGPQFISSIAKDEGEYSGDGLSPAKGPSTPNRKPRTVSIEKDKTKVTASSSGSGSTEYERELEERKRRLNSEKLLKNAEEETLRKKPTAMTEQMRKAPTIRELYKGQKSMGDEIGDVLKSFRETIRGGLQKGKERQESKGSTMYAKGGKVKRMYDGGAPDGEMGPQPRSARLTLSAPEPQSARLTLSPSEAPRGRGMATNPEMVKNKLRYGSDFERPANPDRVKSTPVTKPMPMGEFEEGKGYGNRGPRPQLMQNRTPELPPERAPTPIERMPYQEPERQMPKMPDGEMVPRSPIEPPPPRSPIEPSSPKEPPARDVPMGSPRNPHNPYMKTGGTVKKMAQGGYAKADGVASRGKTQPKMVKMAKGGFVKTADGCAQRGKTKAFQVKMNRGGKC